jgi:CubicO group peptidase (beta-lactamase class C family)
MPTKTLIGKSPWSRRKFLISGLSSAGLARWSAASTIGLSQSNTGTEHSAWDTIGRGVEAETRAGRATGISISVAKKGIILCEGGFGSARKNPAIATTAHTPFSLASITKTFTAAAVMRLVQAGKLDLDAPIDRYLQAPLPRSRFDPKAVTLRLLGGHAAGLPSLFDMFDESRASPTIAELIHKYGELAYPAGERYEYANLGYSLLGQAVSRVTGQEFSTSLNDLVIRPLRLRDTFFDTDGARLRDAAGRFDKNNRVIPFYRTATPPSGELYASAHDLSIFAANMMGIKSGGGARLLSREALDALFSPVFTAGTSAFTTFGWSGRDVAGERVIVKTGGQPGVAARLTLLPKRGISIAVIANRDDNRAIVANISSEIASSLMSDWSNPDFRMDEASDADPGMQGYAGSWTGAVRNGETSERIRILIDAAGVSMCQVGGGSPRPIKDMTNHSRALAFNVDGGISSVAVSDGTMRQLEFKLIDRKDALFGRCLSACDRPGYTSTVPYIVTLSRSS